MIKNVFLAMKKRIEEVPGIDAVYLYHRKRLEENDGDNPLFVLPSVHIEFRNLNAASMTHGIEVFQNAEIVIYVVSESLYNDEEESTLIATFDLVEAVHSKLKMFAPRLSYLSDNTEHTQILFNSLHRQSMQIDHDSSNMYITQLTYSAVIYDYDNMPTYTLVNPVNLNITTDLI